MPRTARTPRATPVPQYATVVRNYRAMLVGYAKLTPAELRKRADSQEAAYDRWRVAKRPVERHLLIGALLGIRATRKIARELEAR